MSKLLIEVNNLGNKCFKCKFVKEEPLGTFCSIFERDLSRAHNNDKPFDEYLRCQWCVEA